jgi:hypothetical protein
MIPSIDKNITSKTIRPSNNQASRQPLHQIKQLNNQTTNQRQIQPPRTPVTTYHEKKIGSTLYRVTSVYKGEIDLGKALEDLTVRKILRGEGSLSNS